MKTYGIREISQMFRLPASTMRYYEDSGLLPKVERTENGQRIYTEEHVKRLHAIFCFKRTNLPISKIQEFFHYEEDIESHIDEIIALVEQHEKNIEEQIKKLEEGRLHIQHKVRFYKGIKDAIEQKRCWPCWEDYKEEEK